MSKKSMKHTLKRRRKTLQQIDASLKTAGIKGKVDRVMIGIPTHSPNNMNGMCVSACTYAFNTAVETMYQISAISLLTRNFNQLFCNAYTENCDYFILLHADVVPAAHGWASELLKIAKQTGAAAVSQMLPIKSYAGLSSLGLDMVNYDYDYLYDDPLDQPSHYRRATVTECHEIGRKYDGIITREGMAEEYGAEDPGALLINTGMLIMDVKEHARLQFPGFQFKDRIVWDNEGNTFVYNEPEDWRYSRWLHMMGLDYCATTRINATHAGGGNWSTQEIWGRATDDSDTANGKCPLPRDFRKNGALYYMDEMDEMAETKLGAGVGA